MYDTLSSGYDSLYGKEQVEKLTVIAPYIKGKVLDLGAGTGIVARNFPNVTSLDPSKNMLRFAPEPKVLAQAESIPFPAKTFDTIVSLTALHHTDINKVIQELKRMKPRNMAFTILKKSKICKEIVEKLQKNLGMKIVQKGKDIILVIENTENIT